MVKYLAGESDGVPLKLLLGIKYKAGESEGVTFIIPPLRSRMVTVIRYVDLAVLIKREGVIVDGCTTYTPYKREKPIEVQEAMT